MENSIIYIKFIKRLNFIKEVHNNIKKRNNKVPICLLIKVKSVVSYFFIYLIIQRTINHQNTDTYKVLISLFITL